MNDLKTIREMNAAVAASKARARAKAMNTRVKNAADTRARLEKQRSGRNAAAVNCYKQDIDR